MRIEYYCPLWGSESLPFEEFLARVAEAGYDGVEMPFPLEDPEARDRRAAAVRDAGLKLIAQQWEAENPDPRGHLAEYEERLRHLAAARPEFISSQTGRDFFSFEVGRRLVDAARRVSAETGVDILHETHRSKMTFSAPATRRFLEAEPDMRLTLDVSHWFCVHERFLADQAESLSLAIRRTRHIHARVGHTQGSQVPDFRSPEWRDVLEIHLEVWDRIAATAEIENQKRLTVTPEFGPAPYMLVYPGTERPLADQWALNTGMMSLLRDRWG